MRKFLLAGLAGLAMIASGSANAADLGRPTYKAPPPVVPPAPLPAWTGCYIGANIGGGWSHKHFDNDFGFDDGGHTASGIVGGGQFGCDYQFGLGKGLGGGGWVIGFQTMWDGAGLSGDHHVQFDDGVFFHDETFHTHVHWFGTLTGRLGYLITPALLLYGKGGVAWVGEDHSVDDNVAGVGTFHFDRHVTRTGWDAGVGLEWMFVPGWSAFVEWDHMGFGRHGETFADCCFSFNEHVRQDVDKVVVGVNWRFGGFGKGKAPVVARY